MGNSTSSGESPAVGGKAFDDPLLFHSTCSENIALEAGGKRAIRQESFCKGICFSRRPVRINERVCLRVVSLSTNWSGFLRIGFTSHNPGEMNRSQLPRYACPDLVNLPGYWAKALPERFSAVNNVISYYVAPDGTVHLLLNQENFGIFFDGVDTKSTLWAMADIYGNCTGIEIIDEMSTARVPMLPAPIEIPASTPLKFYKQVSMQPPVFFHSFCGQNVYINPEGTIATRQPAQYNNGYVFLSRPLQPNERVVVQVLTVETIYKGGLTVGVTSCNPSMLDQGDMPDDADALLDRTEYWVVHKDVHVNAVCGDELAFSLGTEGELHFSKNGLHSSVILHVDKTIPLWLFLDIYGQIGKLQLYGVAAAMAATGQPAASPGLSAPTLLPVIPLRLLDGEAAPSGDSSPRNRLVSDGGLRVELPPPGHLHNGDVVSRPRQLPPGLAPAAASPSSASAAAAPLLLPLPLPAAASATNALALPPVPPRISRSSGGSSAVRLPAPIPSSTAAVPSCSTVDALPPSATVRDEMPRGVTKRSECIVCFEKPCDTVIYKCGHVCMCFACATSVRQQAPPLCPICRQVIEDVIRMFAS